MTYDEIDNQQAGRQLDALIEETFFGHIVDWEFDEPHVPALRDRYDEWGYLSNYSTEAGSAMLLIDWHLAQSGQGDAIIAIFHNATGWHVSFGEVLERSDEIVPGYGGVLALPRLHNVLEASAETVSLALCRAALKWNLWRGEAQP